MIILGAGMAGCLAGLAFGEATILEQQREMGAGHQALLRFRSSVISDFTGIPFDKVKVYKSIWSNGQHCSPTPRLFNLYSRKVAGSPQTRSINNLEPEYRWLAPKDFHQRLINLLGNRIVFGAKTCALDQIPRKPGEAVESTIPLPSLAKFANIEIHGGMESSSIFVERLHLGDANAYQTIYFPDPNTSVYRASISKDVLIIESMNPIDMFERSEVLDAFGLLGWPLESEYKGEQKLGKIIPLPDDVRKDFLFHMSTTHNIWSLGRYACWRNVLLDDVYGDIFKIRKMMGQSKYDVRRMT